MRLWNFVAVCLGLIAASADARTLTVTAPARNFTGQADALMKAYVGTDAFSGTVLVANNGRVIYRRSDGLANRELNAANRSDRTLR